MPTNIPKKLGKYDVLDVVGRGGMGIVYKATDPGIGRLVAIKMITVGYADDPELLKRFYREAQSAGKLQHPNIVTIFDLGDQDGNPYMVMEFLEGESLDSIIASHRSISLEQKLHIAIQVCNALNYAHQHGVIHRDIKPANVMVLKDFTVKIVDFGIARIGKESVTRPGQLMGSVPHMSPEQIKDKAYVDSRTDIFSAGVLLYQLLTNELPFDGKDMGAILLKIIHDPPPSLQTWLPEYPSELDPIIALALAKNPEERYATADSMAFDLMRVQDELKREMVHEYLESVDKLVAAAQWSQAKEQILQLLRVDRQNSRANELLGQVDQQIQTQKRSEQARELRVQAEQAIRHDELTDALRYLDQAVKLDSSHELLELRDSVAERKARAAQLASLLHRAESARDTGELEEAQKAVAEALLLEHDNREAQALNAIIAREIAEYNKLKQVQGFLDEARKRIASRSFTAALDVLKKAELLSPTAPGVKELANLAISGQEQEKRRKQLEAFNSEIENALSRDNFALACARADEGLQLFPEDRGLLKLKRLAEKQRQASEKRAYVEGQIASSRQLLDSADPDQSLIPLEEALKKYPQEPALISMLSVVKESLARRREEQRKADCLQKARDAIRRKAYTEAIETLEATRKEISSSDLDDLLQFAQEEAANYATRQKIDAAAGQAHQFVSADEYQSAIDLLEATLAEVADEELTVILDEARRRLQEFNQRVKETVSTAQRLLRQDRFSEAVRFLEAQSEQCGRSPELTALLEQSRQDLNRVQSFSITKENVREALSRDDFPGAAVTLQQFRDKFGDTLDAKVLQEKIEAARSRAATSAMEKALPDVRMLLMVRSLDSAEGILDSLSQSSPYAAPPVKEQYESLLAVAQRAKAQRSARELEERLYQAQVSDQLTATLNASQESIDPGNEIGPTDAMNRTQLENLLGKVAQIGDHYQGNQKVQSAIQDFKRRLTLRMDALEEELEPAPPAPGPEAAPEYPQPLTATQLPEQEPQAACPVASTTPDEPQSDLSFTQQYAESARPAAEIPEDPAAIAAAEALAESEQAALRQQEAVRNAIQQGQDLLSQDQPILAMQILQQAAAQYPGQSEIEELLALAESRAQEQKIVAIERQADAETKQGQFEQALSTLAEGLAQFPEAEPLRKARESVSTARDRAERLAEARRLRGSGELQQALELVEAGLQSDPQDRELEALKLQIESDQAKRQRQEAIADATERAQRHLREGQTILAIEVLRRYHTRFPDDETVSRLLRTAEEQLRKELEVNSIRTRAENLVREGREQEAVVLIEKNLSKDPAFEELLATTRSKLNAKRREESFTKAVLLQRQARYGEAHGLVQQAIRQYGSTPASADLERTLHDQIEAERRQKSHDADRDKLLAIELQVPTTKQAKLKKLAVRAQQIAAPYAAEDDNAGIASRILQRVELELATAAPPKPIPVRQIAAGAAATLAIMAGIMVIPRLFRVTAVPVEIRTDPPGASVRIGDRSCLSPNCRFDLKPGQYQIEARRDGYKSVEQSLTVDSTQQIAPINLMMQPVPPPPPPPLGTTVAATGTLVVQSALPDALVFVDHTPRGRTDERGVFSMQLEARSHQILVEKNGYRTPRGQQVDIVSGASRQLTFSLGPLRSEAQPEPRLKAKSEAEQSRQAAEDKTKNADKLQHDQLLADLQTAARQDLNRSDFTSARQKADQIKAAGGSSGTLITEIDQAEAQASRAVQYENSYQQAFQQYRQAAASNDKSGLEEARNSFQSIAQQGDSHAADAQKYSHDIDKRLVALNQPPPNTAAPPTTAHVKPEELLRGSVDESAAVGNVIKKYEQAFDDKNVDELRQIWPDIGKKYADYKKSFENAQAQHVEVVNQTVKISDNGEQATVTASLIDDYTPKGSKMMKRTDRVQFELIKKNGTWAIRSVQ
jgi:serine/threonine-protein kinase